jgi:hypothetical protein
MHLCSPLRLARARASPNRRATTSHRFFTPLATARKPSSTQHPQTIAICGLAPGKLFPKKRLPHRDELLVSAPRNPAGVAKAAGENHAEAAREKSFEFLVDHVGSLATLLAPQESGSAEKQIVLHFWDFKLNSILSRQQRCRLGIQVSRTKH